MAQFDQKSPDYWIKRAEWIEQNVMKDVDKVNKQLIDGYNIVLKDVQRDIASFIAENDLASMSKAVTIKDYLQGMDENFKQLEIAKKYAKFNPQAEQGYKDLINQLNVDYRLTRLQVLEKQLQAKIGTYGVQMNSTMEKTLQDVYTQAYDRKQFVISRGVGYGYQYGQLNEKAIEKAILYPWAKDGSMFSNRIWDYVNNESSSMVKAVRRTLASDVMAMGKHPSRIANNIVGFGDPSLSASRLKFNASRLLQTEASHIIGEAEAQVSKEWGFTEYKYLATLDDRTSSVCQGLDGETFKYKDRQVGTNYPPMHPLCRSTTYDVVPNADYGKRASRNKHGATVHEIPATVTYPQWKIFQETGKKVWEGQSPTATSFDFSKLNKAEMLKNIMAKHETLMPKKYLKELEPIAKEWDNKKANLYNKLSEQFKHNDYKSRKKGAFYSPWARKVQMGMSQNDYERAIGIKRNGAFNTKFHEEFHQLDHLLGNTKFGKDAYGNQITKDKFTDPRTVLGKKMITAIDEDIKTVVNNALDDYNKNYGTKVSHINSVDEITTYHPNIYELQKGTAEYLKKHFPDSKTKAEIGAFTDAMGLSTKDALPPFRLGFWGHSSSYNKSRGKAGATSETWATFGANVMDNLENESLKKVMPNTLKAYNESLEQVIEHLATEDLSY